MAETQTSLFMRTDEELFDKGPLSLNDNKLSALKRFNLTKCAERLRLYLAGDRTVTQSNRPVDRELAAARVMSPVHTFVGGREAEYRLTYWGHARRFELAGIAPTKDSA